MIKYKVTDSGKTLREIQHLYLRFKDYIFDTWSRPYNTSALEAFMQVELGADTTLADVKHPRLLVTTVEGDVIPVKLKLLRNYDMPLSEKDKKDMGYEKPEDWTVWKALRCSSAAPTFFCSVDGKFIDGGLISNNPLCELLSEIHLYNTACKLNQGAEEPVRIGCVLSLGTGIAASRPSESVDMTGAFSNLVANVLAIKSLGIILIDQVTATEGAPVDRSRSWCHSLGVPLFRMSAPLTNDVQMDEKGDAEIVQLLWDCLEYTQRHRDDIAELVALLRLSGKSEHRRKLFTDSEISAEAFAEASSEASAEAFAEASAEAFAEASAEASPEVSSKPSPEVSSKPSLEVSWNLSPEVSPEPSSEASPKLFSEVSRRK
uniref:PNPLA domain-containing protein n=1 Tax=Plectus sambesii TaxID=2011161 RepID=A0A914XFB5_9BILA